MNMIDPIVSIITPTYNHSKYIGACIESALKQTFTNWEMIVVNDGSTDNTSEIVKQYADNDQRITLIDQKNIGIFRLKESYNRALEISRGKYITILEGDDLWEPEKLERQVDVFERNPSVVFCWGKAEAVTSDLSEVLMVSPASDVSNLPYYNNQPTGSVYNLLLIENFVTALTMAIRREVLVKMGGFKQGYDLPLVDIPTILEVAKYGAFHYDNSCLGKWRNYANQITKTYPVQISKGRYQLVIDCFNNLPADIRKNVNLTLSDLHRYFKNKIMIDYARSGRYKLIRKQYREARSDYWRAIFSNSMNEPVWKMRAITGYIFSLFGMDIEWMARIMGKKTYK